MVQKATCCQFIVCSRQVETTAFADLTGPATPVRIEAGHSVSCSLGCGAVPCATRERSTFWIGSLSRSRNVKRLGSGPWPNVEIGPSLFSLKRSGPVKRTRGQSLCELRRYEVRSTLSPSHIDRCFRSSRMQCFRLDMLPMLGEMLVVPPG